MKWFGKSWGAPICDEVEHVATPVGAKCMHCDQEIDRNAQGFLVPHLDLDAASSECPWHLDCFLWTIGVRSTRR
jgi:hypothetical protein